MNPCCNLCLAPSAAPATQNPSTEHQVPRLPRKIEAQSERKGRQGVHQGPCRAPSAAPATQNPNTERRSPRDARGRQGVHQAPCRAPSAAPATQNPSTERRSPRDATGDARAYIRPLVVLKVPRLPRKIQAQSAGAHVTPGDARADVKHAKFESSKCPYRYIGIKPAIDPYSRTLARRYPRRQNTCSFCAR